ncbi:hypothetical protein ADIAL_0213 [Alkalibacterium sp. AK22]|uniref:hypothetical protein n=1 Tax=Alkalibacterium sp. AK22 TaxID=1229520 RepID=UPI00044ADC15|nr:hypothetical protein [Alkalibacterium sp. AK22]EXJ24280.1 hypothetical protein ADIAL_0213 [Alkalibacterium sp. AK22]
MDNKKHWTHIVKLIVIYSLFFAGLALIGFQIGLESAEVASELTPVGFVLGLILVMIMVPLFMYIQVILHEGGHLLAGALSGYHFMLFRIGSFGVIKEKGKYRTISFSMSGTMGQCLMNPPEHKETIPFRFYLLGGCSANFVSSFVALLIHQNRPSAFLLLFAFLGLAAGLTNAIPFSFNDGAILKKISQNPVARKQFFQQLKWNAAFILDQKTYSEMRADEAVIDPSEPLTEQFNVYASLIQINGYLEQEHLDTAYQALRPLFAARKQIIAPYRSEVLREMLYLSLLLDRGTPEQVESIRSDKLFKAHLNNSQVDVFRVKCVIAYFLDNDRKQAEKEYNAALKALERSPTHADQALNRTLLAHLNRTLNLSRSIGQAEKRAVEGEKKSTQKQEADNQ